MFFFLPELRSGVHRGDPYGVPLCTYEHPYGVLIPDPRRGPVTLRFIFFRSRTVSLRLPGSLTTPSGWYRTRWGPVYATCKCTCTCTCTCTYKFWPFWMLIKSFCAGAFLAKIVLLSFLWPAPFGDRYHTPSGCDIYTSRVYSFHRYRTN